MSNFGALLRRLRKEHSYSLNVAARKLNTQKGYLSGIENGKVNPPSARLVRRIAQLYGQDERMLLRLAWADKAPSLIREEAVRMVNHVALEDDFSPDVVSVPLLNPDGQPYPAEPDAAGAPRPVGSARLVLPRSRPQPEFAAVIVDDSMDRDSGPRYRKGDVVLLARTRKLEAGGMAYVMYRGRDDNRAVIRQVWEERGGLVLKPLNDRVPLEFVAVDDMVSCYRVVGKIEIFATGLTA